MNPTIEVWVEVVPDEWPDWRSAPWGVRAGRILKKRPKPEERGNFVKVKITVDMVARFGGNRAAEVG